MASTFQMIVTPDATLNISPVNMTATLDDPSDFQVFLSYYQAIWGTSDSTPTEVIQLWIEHLINNTMSDLENWVRSQKIAEYEANVVANSAVTMPNITLVDT